MNNMIFVAGLLFLIACGGEDPARVNINNLGGSGGDAGAGGGGVMCEPDPVPSCDGYDDDCDSQIDETDELAFQIADLTQPGPYKSAGANCHAPGEKGVCGDGKWTCTTSGMICNTSFFNNEPTVENCSNNLDDDCDGETDEFEGNENDNCGGCGMNPDGSTNEHYCKRYVDGNRVRYLTSCFAGHSCVEDSCNNGLDDDGNGLTDCEDPSCAKKQCNSPDAVAKFCTDGYCK